VPPNILVLLSANLTITVQELLLPTMPLIAAPPMITFFTACEVTDGDVHFSHDR
jgi:hypothetical protein